MELAFNHWKKIALTELLFLLLALVDMNLKNNKSILFAGLAFTFLLVLVFRIHVFERYSGIFIASCIMISSFLSLGLSQYMILGFGEMILLPLKMWILNTILFVCLHLMIYIVTYRIKIACIVVHFVIMIYSFIDYLVLSFRNNELTLADLSAYKTGLSVARNYTADIPSRCLYAVLASFIFCFFLAHIEVERVKDRKMTKRLISAASLFICMFGLLVSIKNIPAEVYGRVGTIKNGYFVNLVLQIRDTFVRQPEGYSREKVDNIYSDYRVEDSDDEKNPAIIVIMNESFSDLSVMGEFTTNQPVMPFYDALTENTIKGYGLSSIYGGKTASSEWEFLTENTMAFLPSGSVVYQQYMDKISYSILEKLHDREYTCVAMHPYKPQGYNRDKVYPVLGFDEIYFLEYFNSDKRIRNLISDQEFYEKIIQRYEESKDKNIFIFGVSMQNHGGYSTDVENFKQEINVEKYDYDDVNCYLSLMKESDKALEYLISYFKNVEEPVEIVIFGDHQPSLNQDFVNSLLSQNVNASNIENIQKTYLVPFMVWTNYDIEEEQNVMTSFNYLPTLMFQNAGISLNQKELFLANSMKTIAAMNPEGFYSVLDKRFKTFDEANEEEQNVLNSYKYIQYYEMFDK